MKAKQESMLTFEHQSLNEPLDISRKSIVRWGLTKECRSCWLLAVTSVDATFQSP